MLFFGPRVKNVSTTELAEKLKAGRPVLIDVREPSEYASGHVPRAINIPVGEIASRMGELDPSAETYVICQSGRRSLRATKALTKAGFANVSNVVGGTSAWSGKLKR